MKIWMAFFTNLWISKNYIYLIAKTLFYYFLSLNNDTLLMQVIPIRRTCQFVAVHEIFQSVYWISCGKRQIPLWKIMPLAPLRCKWRGFESHLIVFLTVNKLRGQSSCLKNRKNLLNYWTLCPIKKKKHPHQRKIRLVLLIE